MSEIIQLAPSATLVSTKAVAPAIRTDSVYVVFTTIEGTMAAVRIAYKLGKAMSVPLTLIHFRTVPYRMSVDAPSGLSPIETGTFASHLRVEGFDVQIRVYLCRNEWRAIPLAFKQRSLIVVGGQRRWWGTLSGRWRRKLEAAGHFVVYVDTAAHSARAADSSRVSEEKALA
jgi:hypothetical protein